jgi:hypothetical protein
MINASKIRELLLENDLLSKSELIKIFKTHTEVGESQQELRSIIIDYLIESDGDLRISNFDKVRFYGHATGLSRFVANQLLLSLNVSSIENKTIILNEVDLSLRNLYDSKNPLLKVTKARLLIELLKKFIGDHFHRITHQRFLAIYFVPFESKQSNAAFDINTNSIAVFRTKEEATQTPEYIFIHEFGHILHSTIFKTSKKVPESFVEFNKKMNPKFFEYSKEDQLEIYADLFSVAVMLDSEFRDYNPFINTMQSVHLRKIKDYFVNEISNLKC